jgi:hypothetical protein
MSRCARFLTVLLLMAPLLGARASVAQDTAPSTEDRARPKEIMASLERALAWYQDARLVMQAARSILLSDLAHDEEQTALRALQRAFDAARARAALLAQADGAGSPVSSPRGQRAERRAKLQAAIQQSERDIARLDARIRNSTAATRRSLERERVAAFNRLELSRVQLDFVTRLEQFAAGAAGDEVDLADQIQALQDAVPDGASPGAATVVTTSPRASSPTGAWALVYRLLALQRSRRSLEELDRGTTEIAQSTEADIQALRQTVRPVLERLRKLAKDPVADGTALSVGQEEFHDQLERAKMLGAVMLPLREEAALLRRYAADIEGWRRAVHREVGQVLRGLALEFVGVGLALAAIFAGSVLWRAAAARYVTNVYHRRLLMTTRHVVVVTAVALVLVFRFMSELTALVAALGFAAAGIAFALQNVILAVAGYFSMVAPNGIRVGDRVSLQGPFGYVHGQVIEIGVVRTRLQEMAGEPLRPTGRIIVVPNSVAFTGSFIKHPPAEARQGERAVAAAR